MSTWERERKPDLEGRTVAITGGSSGIGLATAAVVLREGGRVAILAREPVRLRAAHDRLAEFVEDEDRVFSVAGDAVDPVVVSQFLDQASQQLGGVNGFVAAAGSTQAFDLLTGDLDVWRATLEANLTASLVGARAAAERVGEGGAIVLIGSLGAWRVSDVSVPYGIAKGGISFLARALGIGLADRGIRVTCVVPGYIDTPMTRLGFELRANGDPQQVDHIRNLVERSVPAGRLGNPMEVGEMIAFVLSNRASFVTGSDIFVDGGEMAAFGRPPRKDDR